MPTVRAYEGRTREALRILRAGVAGIFHKQQAPEDLRRSIPEVFEGKVLIEEHYLRKLVQVTTTPDDAGSLRLTNGSGKAGAPSLD